MPAITDLFQQYIVFILKFSRAINNPASRAKYRRIVILSVFADGGAEGGDLAIRTVWESMFDSPFTNDSKLAHDRRTSAAKMAIRQ